MIAYFWTVPKGYDFPLYLPEIPNGSSGGAFTVFKKATENIKAFQPTIVSTETVLNYYFEQDQNAVLSIYDINGQMVKSAELKGVGAYTLNVIDMPPGVYLYTISDSKSILYRDKLIVVK